MKSIHLLILTILVSTACAKQSSLKLYEEKPSRTAAERLATKITDQVSLPRYYSGKGFSKLPRTPYKRYYREHLRRETKQKN